MPGLHLLNVLKDSAARSADGVQPQHFTEPFSSHLRGQTGIFEKPLEFRGKGQPVVLKAVKQRPYAETVPAEKGEAAQGIVHHKGVAAAKPGGAGFSITKIGFEYNFGVAARMKMEALRLQFPAELCGVPEFSVIGDGKSAAALMHCHGLQPVFRILQGKPYVGQRAVLGNVSAPVVRPPMGNPARHPARQGHPQVFFFRQALCVHGESCNAAHLKSNPFPFSDSFSICAKNPLIYERLDSGENLR